MKISSDLISSVCSFALPGQQFTHSGQPNSLSFEELQSTDVTRVSGVQSVGDSSSRLRPAPHRVVSQSQK